MRITNLKLEHRKKRTRVSALVEWEDSDRQAKEIFIETVEDFGRDISDNPHAFLVGCIIPAIHFGEKRIQLEAEICPGLREGLKTVMALMKQWSGGEYRPLTIETKISSAVRHSNGKRRAGMFLSGGIDSLASLRINKTNYPAQHPGSVKDCLLIHGFDIGGVVERGMKYHVFERALAAMSRVAEDADVTLIPIYTNIRHLCDERDLWLNKFFGAVLASVAHAFDSRLNLVYVAASYDIPNLAPCGSHPLC